MSNLFRNARRKTAIYVTFYVWPHHCERSLGGRAYSVSVTPDRVKFKQIGLSSQLVDLTYRLGRVISATIRRLIMPMVRIDLMHGRNPASIKKLCDAVHAAVLEAFDVPAGDRYQIVHEHSAHTLIIEDTGLGIDRSEKVVVISVVSRPRGEDAKVAFYRIVCERLQQDCGIAPSDVVINISTNSDADWSFGYGRAQFLTGEL